MSECVLWTGPKTKAGYGTDRLAGRSKTTAHRAAWIREHGPIAPGLEVCHSCDVRACVNLDHLWLGTHQQNQADMSRKGRASGRGRPAVSRCPRGHEYTEANSRYNARGHRGCKACEPIFARKYRAQRRLATS